MNIEQLRFLCNDEKIKWTLHALKRIRERGIKSSNVIDCIKNGRIIEEYPDDRPFPSCLICGQMKDDYLHAVVSTDGAEITIITAYIPDADEWENYYTTRKAAE